MAITERELWQSDGTTGGTVLLKDINPGPGSSDPVTPFSANVEGEIFFSANDGEHGVELWESDGTAAGTVLVADAIPGTSWVVSKSTNKAW